MDILCKRYFGRLRLLKSSDVEENSGPRASRRSCRVVYANIMSLRKKLSELLFISRGGGVVFVLRLYFLPGATFPSLWFRVLLDRCSCLGVRLIVRA